MAAIGAVGVTAGDMSFSHGRPLNSLQTLSSAIRSPMSLPTPAGVAMGPGAAGIAGRLGAGMTHEEDATPIGAQIFLAKGADEIEERLYDQGELLFVRPGAQSFQAVLGFATTARSSELVTGYSLWAVNMLLEHYAIEHLTGAQMPRGSKHARVTPWGAPAEGTELEMFKWFDEIDNDTTLRIAGMAADIKYQKWNIEFGGVLGPSPDIHGPRETRFLHGDHTGSRGSQHTLLTRGLSRILTNNVWAAPIGTSIGFGYTRVKVTHDDGWPTPTRMLYHGGHTKFPSLQRAPDGTVIPFTYAQIYPVANVYDPASGSYQWRYLGSYGDLRSHKPRISFERIDPIGVVLHDSRNSGAGLPIPTMVSEAVRSHSGWVNMNKPDRPAFRAQISLRASPTAVLSSV